MINEGYTFDRFVVGENNRFAYNVSVAVAQNPCGDYNPLYLHADVGLGKTHLMKSIEAYLNEYHPELRVMYLDACKFTNEFIESIKQSRKNVNAMHEFKMKYRREVDVLLVDDIQFLIGKERTQEEFFNVFNDLYLSSKQLVISSDILPKELVTLDERLSSRFGMGIIANITAPDYDTRLRILESKQELQDYKLDKEKLDFIANNVKHSIRSLEGALNKLIACARIYPELEEVEDLDLSKLLKEYIDENDSQYISGLTMDCIMEKVAEHYQLTLRELKGISRAAKITLARQIAMYLTYNLIEGITLQTIGDYLGGRNHATVMHGVRKVDSLMGKDEEIQSKITGLKAELSA